MVDALFREKTLSATLDYNALITSQPIDDEVKPFLCGNTSLQLKWVQLPILNMEFFCDISTPNVQPFIKNLFDEQHLI